MSSLRAERASGHVVPKTRIVKTATVCEQPQVVNNRAPKVEAQAQPDLQARVQEARALAERFLLQARAEAERLLQVARVEAETLRRQAQEQGWQEGRQAGQQDAEAEMLEQVQGLRQLATQAQVDRYTMVQSAREQIIGLVVEATEKVVRHEIANDPSVVVRVTEEALRQINSDEPVKIRVNPADWEMVSVFWTRTRDEGSEERVGEIVVDERVSPGGCVVETRTGIVNGEIEVQIAEIGRALTE